jgi:hypothetical protein
LKALIRLRQKAKMHAVVFAGHEGGRLVHDTIPVRVVVLIGEAIRAFV